MKPLVVALLLAFPLSNAQTLSPKAPVPASKQWASVGAATRFAISSGTGLTIAYGREDFFAPGTDARSGFSYFSAPLYTDGGGFSAELSADALAYTKDPDPDTGLTLIAYGGLGPRLLVQTNIYSYDFDNPNPDRVTAFNLNVGGVGGLETRLNNFGVFLELDITLPTIGLVGPQFRVFPFETGLGAKLTLGSNYYF